jgi:predicted Zn-dependent protease
VLWGQGKRTGDVIREAFGVPAQEYDARYRAWQAARLARYDRQYMFSLKPQPLEEAKAALAAAPKSAAAHDALAFALLRAHKMDEAGQELQAALALDPNDADAHYLSAMSAGKGKDGAAQEKHLRAIQAAGGDGYTVEMGLAEVAEGKHDRAGERAALEAAHRFDPTQPEPVRGLYDAAKEDKRDADALDALRALAPLDQHDRRAWHLLLAKLVEAKRWDEARKVGESAMYVDVESAETHVDYARALAETGDHEKAAFELGSALLCEAKAPEKAEMHALLAREKQALGDVAGAKAERDEALKIDANNATAKGLKL